VLIAALTLLIDLQYTASAGIPCRSNARYTLIHKFAIVQEVLSSGLINKCSLFYAGVKYVRPRLAPAQSEDCLYINVRTPDSSLWDADAAKPSKLLPVFVWIHGGDHQDGAGKYLLTVSYCSLLYSILATV
jgi:Carboxylesterase family